MENVSGRSDEFIISSLFRDLSSVDLDVDSAYAGVTRRVQHVKRRRVALAGGAACVALLGGVVFAGIRIGTPDGVRPGGPATDQRGDLTPDSGSVTTSTLLPATAMVEPPAVTPTEPIATAAVADDDVPENSAAPVGGSSGAAPSTASDSSAPSTTDDDGQSGHEGPDTTDDGHSADDSGADDSDDHDSADHSADHSDDHDSGQDSGHDGSGGEGQAEGRGRSGGAAENSGGGRDNGGDEFHGG